MITWKILLIGAAIFLAFLGYACCVVAGRADEQEERFFKE